MPIDLDILLYDERTIEGEELQVPHPRLAERAFVLVPLAEIAPDTLYPGRNETIVELAQAVDTSGVRRIKDVRWDGVAGREGRVRL